MASKFDKHISQKSKHSNYRDAKPCKPMHKSGYNSTKVKDPLHRNGAQMLELKNVEKKGNCRTLFNLLHFANFANVKIFILIWQHTVLEMTPDSFIIAFCVIHRK